MHTKGGDNWLPETMEKVKNNKKQVLAAERIVKRDRDLNDGAVMSVTEAHRVTASENQFMSPNPPASMADIHLPKAQYVSPGVGLQSYVGARFSEHDMGHKARMRVGYGDRTLGESGSSAIKVKNATLGR
jgi:hypothetical protein